MTEGELPVTERAVKRFVLDYFESLEGSIQKQGKEWEISLTPDAETALDVHGETVEFVADPEDASEGNLAIGPGSELFERIVSEAAESAPVGAIKLAGDDIDFVAPDWLDSDFGIMKQGFTPFYDREALCVLFHVGIETVSEYQHETLRAVSVDLIDHEPRPGIAKATLTVTSNSKSDLSGGSRLPPEDAFGPALDACRALVETSIESTVQKTRERATRASKVEIEEYRQFLDQRREEIEAEESSLTNRIDELRKAIETADERSGRVELLRQRKRLKNELTQLREELDRVRSELDDGVAEKRERVRGRHSLTVRIRPVTATLVTYERGELELSIGTEDRSAPFACDYAVGVGVFDQPSCEACGTVLGAENQAIPMASRIVGTRCCSGQPPME
jgi:hypothetical protein